MKNTVPRASRIYINRPRRRKGFLYIVEADFDHSIQRNVARRSLPPMASNLLPFPVMKSPDLYKSRHSEDDDDQLNDDSARDAMSRKSTVKKKSSSLASLVKGRRSSKRKSREVVTKHKRSFSLNRFTASRSDKAKTMTKNGSKEI